MLSPFFLQLTLFYALLACAQSSLQLGYIPLAVKTPYLHAWLRSNGGQSPAHTWPNFVLTDREFGWAGMIRVDSQGYQWMGDSGFNFTRTVTSEVTPSKSIFRLEAGPIQFNLTFLSPIEPNDYVRQSMPFSYMYIDGIAANDSQPHTVQVYSDISAQWVTKGDKTMVVWNTTESNNIIYHSVVRQTIAPMVENGGISEDGTAYYGTVSRSGLTWQTGVDVDCRKSFAINGTLANTSDTTSGSVSDPWPVFSFSVDLGTIGPGSQPDPIVWTLGLVRDPLVTFTIDGLAQNRSAYYWSKYPNVEEVISAFLGDFPDALNRSLALDNKVLSTASATSPEYANILSLVTRQIFASMDITIPSAQPGQSNTSDVKIFMKDLGQSQRTNPVEVIYGALPALLFFNPFLARDLLQPLFEFQSSPQYPYPYAAPDLGASYPLVHDNATDTHVLAVENCGNMLIMVYAQAAKSGDGALLSRYYPVLQRWADFLVENTLHPRGFITADGLNNPDMSNLALKGILGIYSMAKINEAVGVSNTTYMDQAIQLIKDWKQSAIAADGHIQAVYGQTSSWGLMYNLFPAVWLKTGLIEDSILQSQAQFYAQQNSPDFGLSLDTSRPDTAYPHWTLMTAATIPDSLFTIRNRLITSIYQRAYTPDSTSPLPATYKPSTGDPLSGSGSPILGAAFAVAAMGLQNVNIRASQIGTGSHKTTNVGAVVGGVLGGFAFLLLTATIFVFWRKHKQRRQSTIAAILDEEHYEAEPFTAARYGTANDSMVQISHQTSLGWTPDGLVLSQPQSPPDVAPATLPAGAATPGISRKQREALGLSRGHISMQSDSAVSSFSNLNSAPAPVSATGTEDLRAEVEQLRREMETIRHITDAPPGYT